MVSAHWHKSRMKTVNWAHAEELLHELRPPRMDSMMNAVRYGTVVSAGPWHHFNVGGVQKSSSKAIAKLGVEMARPRFATSVLAEVGIASSFKGLYARVARKLNVSKSMVSRVANGHRFSPKIKKALLEELKAVKQKLDSIGSES